MTDTIIEHDLDSDLFTVLDFEPEFPCEADEDCQNTPDYRVTTKCCAVSLLICEECLFEFMGHWRAMQKRGLASRCMECNHRFPNGEQPLMVSSLKT